MPEQAAFPTLLSDSQKRIAHLLADRPDAYLPENDNLDRVVDGNLTLEQLADQLAETGQYTFDWFDDILPAIDWWRQLADIALQSQTPGGFGPSSKFSEQGETLSGLLRGVLVASVEAHRESSAYRKNWGDPGPATFEFLHRYRTYTRYVEGFVLKVFPNLNRELFLHPDYGFDRAVASSARKQRLIDSRVKGVGMRRAPARREVPSGQNVNQKWKGSPCQGNQKESAHRCSRRRNLQAETRQFNVQLNARQRPGQSQQVLRRRTIVLIIGPNGGNGHKATL